MFILYANSVQIQLLNFRYASLSHNFRNSSLAIIWNNWGLSKHMNKRMEKESSIEKRITTAVIEKELFGPLFERESSCSTAFVASLNHSIILGKIFR